MTISLLKEVSFWISFTTFVINKVPHDPAGKAAGLDLVLLLLFLVTPVDL